MSCCASRTVSDKLEAREAGVSADNLPLVYNADMGPAQVREYCRLDDAGRSLPLGSTIFPAGLRAAMSQLGMSARACHRTACARLARTIADLESAGEIKTHHLAEATQYRPRRQT